MQKIGLFCMVVLSLYFQGCKENEKMIMMDVQGHRGCRGLYPENTLEGFFKAVENGATTLEMDVVISKDMQVVVSHEPWLNAAICLGPNGEKILPAEERKYNLYQMTYDSIKRCDCGSLGNPNFPNQRKEPAFKPLLSEVLEATQSTSTIQGPELRYNIEIKREKQDDSLFYPPVADFVTAVLQEVARAGVQFRTTLQSFDIEILQEIQRRESEQTIALLVDENEDYKLKLGELGFYPNIISPYYKLVDEEMVNFAAEKNLRVIPWTVNEKEDMQRMLDLKVNGIITDYPDVLSKLLNVDIDGKP